MGKKNICIVTVYNTINCGSFWQAFVLGEILKQNGFNVCYFERKGNYGSSNTFRAFLIRCGKRLLKHGFASVVREYKQYIHFVKCQKVFNLKKDTGSYSDIDCFILGSDTIWNLQSQYFSKNRKKYWGFKFRNCCVISYAASIGNTTKEEINKYPELPGYLNALYAISVRDKCSQELISALTRNPVELVCDPTLLWTKDDYKRYIGDKPKFKFVFLYLFKELNENQFKELKTFALNHNLIIIDGAKGDKRADRNEVCEPYNFLTNMFYADYVITDTFHGTIFSIVFEKNFAVINRDKNKVNELLDSVDLSSQLLSGSMAEVLNNDIDYDCVKLKLDNIRNKSINFLISSLSE